jgi:hypothetical protein
VSLLTQIHFDKITEALTVNLPAFLLSKSNNPDPVRALRFLEAFSGGSNLKTSKLKPPENKKPGVERRAQSPFSGVFARSSTYFYPVLVKNLT